MKLFKKIDLFNFFHNPFSFCKYAKTGQIDHLTPE